ncbi:GNAT family N-acetyltransferase [Bifidobacterium thermacidophilum]|uniref:GNAT family N-acetyltransferase n=1 Tax=Bifidobacterium thermacidophilum TaxID=246618 RepID=A0ABW8KTN0_9BIFI
MGSLPESLLQEDLQDGFTLRLATPDEYGAVGDTLEDAFTDGCWVTEEYRHGLHNIEQRARTADVWVIVDGRNAIVAAVLTPKPEYYDGERYTFNVLGVGSAGRGHGLGKALVRHALAVAHAYGYRTVELHSSPQMTYAHRLYYSFGFHRRPDWETIIVDHGQRLLSFTRTEY